jgi:hypothetical protein
VKGVAAALLVTACGCGEAAGVLWIHNGTADTLQVSGIPEGGRSIEAGADLRVDGVSAPIVVVATGHGGVQVERLELPAPVPGGGAVWSIGGTTCYVQGEWKSYYGPSELPPGVEVLGMMRSGERLLVGRGRVAAGPGERLPKRLRSGSASAIVHVPCEATGSEALARGWLELRLPDLEP